MGVGTPFTHFGDLGLVVGIGVLGKNNLIPTGLVIGEHGTEREFAIFPDSILSAIPKNIDKISNLLTHLDFYIIVH